MINDHFSQELDDGTRLYGWKSEPPLTPFAPSFAYYFTDKKIFSEEECKEWNTYLLKQEQILLDKFKIPAGDGGTGLGENSITSRYPYFNVLNFDFYLVEQLKAKIFNGIRYILHASDTTWQDTLYANSWFNVLRQGEGMNAHAHDFDKHTFYGFHLTINATDTFTSYYHPIKFQEKVFHISNKIGYLTLFPNFIPHGVSPNKHETPRISIAGDIWGPAWLDAPSPPANNANAIEIGSYKGNHV